MSELFGAAAEEEMPVTLNSAKSKKLEKLDLKKRADREREVDLAAQIS